MSYVVAIDVGIKNLAVCAYDFVTNKIIHWDNVSLVPNGRYVPALNVQYVRDFVARHDHLFRYASAVLVERQMRCNMRIIEAVLQTLFYERCVVISPRCVKLHYSIGTRNYKQNKAKAVEFARFFVATNPALFAPDVAQRIAHGKQDDLADALILVLYYLDTYSNQLT
jgi:hypothetical protein